MNVIKYYVISISILLIIVNLNSISQSKIISEKPTNINVTFYETGLPTGTKWYVNITNLFTQSSYNSTSTQITISLLSNTNYSYTISTVNKNYSPKPSSGYIDSPSSTTIYVKFNPVLYNVTFTESGLPANTKWYVNVTSGSITTPYSSTSSTITFQEMNGTYNYTISTVNKDYSPSPSSGSFTVNGKDVKISISFILITYYAIFFENGLPNGTAWYINISSQGISQKSTSTLNVISLPNGTYHYTVASVNKSYYPIPNSGNITISGKNVYITIIFKLKTYNVTFKENGLPTGTYWYLNISGNGISTSLKSNNYYINTSLPNGTYNFVPGSSNSNYSSPQGTFVVNGKSLFIYVNFTYAKYPVTFYVLNFTNGTKWFVNLSNGQSYNSTQSYIRIYEYNGNYYYNVSVSNKIYYILPYSGNFVVNGKGLTIYLKMFIKYYNLTVTETGLPSNIKWYFNISNYQSFNTTLNKLIIKIYNGTYNFTVSTVDKDYKPINYTGIIKINGTDYYLNISFVAVKYQIIFNANGLPSGYIWYLNISNVGNFKTNNSKLVIYLMNGTYEFYVSSFNKSYKPNISYGQILVNGNSMSVNITFIAVMYYVKFIENGLPQGMEWYVVLGKNISKTYSNYIEFKLFNGSYNYIIDNPINITNNERFYCFNYKGIILVEGRNITINVSYYLQYYLTIILIPQEGGFSNVSSNWFNINTTLHIGIKANKNYTFMEWIGTGKGSYTGTSSNITIKIISPIIEKAIFNRTYLLVVNEIGLPNGTEWSIYINNKYYNSTNNNISINLINGTYNLIFISSNKDFYANSTTITINGNEKYLFVNFYLFKYPVYFVENITNLMSNWGIIINGTFVKNYIIMGYNDTLIAFLPNGTFNFTVISPKGYHPRISYGEFSINGNPKKINVYFLLNEYKIFITISGIKNNTKWQLFISGKEFNGNNLSLVYNFTGPYATIYLPNGTYNFRVITNGFSVNKSMISVNVNGNNIEYKLSTNNHLFNHLLYYI
ncbi:MAG: hypothetical protein ACP5JT_03995 [Thermoplasmata archaeon]